MRYLVCYDIKEKRRLQRINRCLQGYALPLQESVFIFVGDNRKLQQMIIDLLRIAHAKDDDIRIYPLGRNAKVWEWDKSNRLEGLFIAL